MEEELKRLCRENRELKRANGLLKTASTFLRRNSTDPQANDLLIDAYKDQFGVEAICRALRQADRGFITSGGSTGKPSGVSQAQER